MRTTPIRGHAQPLPQSTMLRVSISSDVSSIWICFGRPNKTALTMMKMTAMTSTMMVIMMVPENALVDTVMNEKVG